MSIVYKQVTVPAKKEEIITVQSHILCDLCGRKGHDGSCAESDWEISSSYNVLETQVSLKTGSSYPEGGDTETTCYDICPDCFRDRLAPFLASLGATPRTIKSEF